MRFPAERRARLTLLTLSAALAACASGSDTGDVYAAAAAADPTGPAADYPMVLGDPYRIDGKLYTPVDTLNYDEVGRIALDPEGGTAITGSHQTLPLPSYVEVTSLESGRTVLVRMERRGPMVANRIAALSPGALEQLGVGAAAPVRIRRVNPPEVERAALRQGRSAPLRMDTPMSLVEVLKRKLDTPAAVATPAVAAATPTPATDGPRRVEVAPSAVAPATEQPAPPPLPPIREVPQTIAPPVASPTPEPQPVVTRKDGNLAVQAASFSSRANADRAAAALKGYVTRAGNYWRVQVGPFADGDDAAAALAKVKAAGYSDARVITLK